MKKLLPFIFLIFSGMLQGQDHGNRIADLENELEARSVDLPGLGEAVNVDLQSTTLANFLIAVSRIHKINLTVTPELSQVNIVNNFNAVSVSDVLLYLCKEHGLRIDFTGNILAVKKFVPEVSRPEQRVIPISYSPTRESITLDLKDDLLYDAFRKITDISGRNIVYAQGLENVRLTAFIKEMPFDAAMDKLAFSNNLIFKKTRDNFYTFERGDMPLTAEGPGATASSAQRPQRPQRPRRDNFYFEVTDTLTNTLNVDFENTPVESVVYDIGNELGLDIFIASPLSGAGSATVKASGISFDQLLFMVFSARQEASGTANNEAQGQDYSANRSIVGSPGGPEFSFKKIDGIYYFGLTDQLSVRSVEIVTLRHRSIELLNDPIRASRSAGRTVGFDTNYTSFGSTNGINDINNIGNQNYSPNTNRFQDSYGGANTRDSKDFLEIIPDDIKTGLDIRVDMELNSFLVSGPDKRVARFRDFITDIDRPIPVILIEVMILEISRNATLEAGVSWGLGTEPTATQGGIFPGTDLDLGANTVNRILGRIDGSSFFNIGQVVPNFFANIRAEETNGNIKIRSSPRIATLNGHRAYFSNGQTSYYAVTSQTFIGSQNPATSEITNYQPIDAELSLDVRPLVSGDGQVTLDMKVIQSDFNGERIAPDAPPGINSREFTSIVKANNNDIIVLGGLEEKRKDDNGSGVPFLSKIPILKWLFSTRVRNDTRSKLTVLIKPTIIY